MGIINQKSTPIGKTATVENRTIDAIVEDVKSINGYINAEPLVFVAKVVQSGSNPPSFTVFKNTIGDIRWFRDGVGAFYGVPENTDLLPENTYLNLDIGVQLQSFEVFSQISIDNNGEISILIFDNAINYIDGFEGYIRIEYYPQ